MSYPKENNEVSTLIDMLVSINEKVKLDDSLSLVTKEDFDQLSKQFKILDTNIFGNESISIDTTDRLDELAYVMAQMASLNFSIEATVRNEYNHIDYIALSLNMMRDRLEDKFNQLNQKIEKLKEPSYVLNAFHNLLLVTNLEGLIISANVALSKQFGINKKEIIGLHIKDFFELKEIKNNYGVDIVRSYGIHDMERSYNKNKTAKVVLRVSAKPFHSDDEVELGYCYKVESLSAALYNRNLTKTIDEKEEVGVAEEKISPVLTTDQRVIFKSIYETYTDKDKHDLMDIMIINSLKEVLDN